MMIVITIAIYTYIYIIKLYSKYKPIRDTSFNNYCYHQSVIMGVP